MDDPPSSPNPPEPLATIARRRRRALGLTQAELADLADCSERFVYMLERGKGTVQLAKVLDVLHTLGLTLVVEPGDQPVSRPQPGDD